MVELLVEPDALQPDARGFERPRGVELADFVDVLRRGVFARGEGVFDDRLGCLFVRGST